MTHDFSDFDFERAKMLLDMYVSINKDGIFQLAPIAGAMLEELKQMMADAEIPAGFTDPNLGVDPETTDHDGDGLVTFHDQNIEDGEEAEDTDDTNPPITTRRPIPTTQRKV